MIRVVHGVRVQYHLMRPGAVTQSRAERRRYARRRSAPAIAVQVDLQAVVRGSGIDSINAISGLSESVVAITL